MTPRLLPLAALASLVPLAPGLLTIPRQEPEEPAAADSRRPHLVLLVADDLGWSSTGFHGSPIRTPHLDRLADEGVRLDQFYVQALCTPTRAALLTGRYPMRYGLQAGVLRPWADYGLDLEERLLSEALRDAGYETAIVGKWHLGHAARVHQPTRRGFDHQYGCFTGSVDYVTRERNGGYDWNRDDRTVRERGYNTDLIAAECERLIAERDEAKPLFLYVAFTAPHSPLQIPPRMLGDYPDLGDKDQRYYAAMVTCMDEAIGRVLAALERAGMREDTLIWFFSDNGAESFGDEVNPFNAPLRGWKGLYYEGGIRVPSVVSWPGRVPAGEVVREPLHVVDVFPTLLRLAGGALEGSKPLDGFDAWPAIAEGAPSPHGSILLNVSGLKDALRRGPWKLVRSTGEEGDRVELFDLSRDPEERRDLAAEEPERVAEMLAELDRFAAEAAPVVFEESDMPEGFEVPRRWGHPDRSDRDDDRPRRDR